MKTVKPPKTYFKKTLVVKLNGKQGSVRNNETTTGVDTTSVITISHF